MNLAPFSALTAALEQRRRDVQAPYESLQDAVRREDWPAEYRRKVATQATASIHSVNATARGRVAKALGELTVAPKARVAEGVRLTSDELTEADHLARRYKDTPKRITEDLKEALDRGATRRARVAWEAARIAGQATDRYARAIEATDTELTDARRTVAVAEHLAATLASDVQLELAQNLPRDTEEWAQASIRAKSSRMALGVPQEAHDPRPAFDVVYSTLSDLGQP